jgi:adenine phosphoribosyltransferase
MRASIDLVEQLGGVVVGLSFLVELDFLKGRDKLRGYDIHTVMRL